ncbi:MAG TPA: hypothetical protein VHP63_02065 [candidate division Zixibacteria bacterium]|nr:hypothetical protein [candidate division Zixibacteria bacterium]
MKYRHSICLTILLVISMAGSGWSQLNIDWEVLSSGGTDASSIGLQLDATIGQTATFQVAGGTHTLGQGYWFASGCCVGNRGDCNFDGTDGNIVDLNFLVNRIFRGGTSSVCLQEADINSDGTPQNILDLNYLVNRIFRGGPIPGPC